MLMLLAVMATSTLAAATHQNRELLGVSTVSWDAANLGKWLGSIWKVSILICLVLLIVDAVMRFGSSKIGVSHSVRFIWFIFGTAVVWLIGAGVPQGYRVFNGAIFSQFYERIYNAYFGSEYVEIFSNTVTAGGTAQSDENLLQNRLFFELIIFIIVRIAALATSGGIAKGNPLSHMLNCIRRALGFYLGLYFAGFALGWYQFIYLVDSNDNADGRAHFNVWLSWAISFYVLAEALWAVVEVALAAASAGGMTEKDYNTTSNPGAGSAIQRSSPDQINEVAFMHQDKKLATANPVAKFYNSAYLFRWLIVVFLAVTWFNKPRTMYWIIVIIDLAFVIMCGMSLGTFYKPLGVLIIISEVLTFLRHLVQIFNWMDQAGSGEMAQFWVDLFTHIAFWSYILSTLIEFVLLFAPLFSGSGSENAASEDVKLDLESNNELGNKISTYKTMKSGKAVGQTPAP
jgi:hypothetical protein